MLLVPCCCYGIRSVWGSQQWEQPWWLSVVRLCHLTTTWRGQWTPRYTFLEHLTVTRASCALGPLSVPSNKYHIPDGSHFFFFCQAVTTSPLRFVKTGWEMCHWEGWGYAASYHVFKACTTTVRLWALVFYNWSWAVHFAYRNLQQWM